jgi:LysM repeat protein
VNAAHRRHPVSAPTAPVRPVSESALASRKRYGKSSEPQPFPSLLPRLSWAQIATARACQSSPQMSEFCGMKFLAACAVFLLPVVCGLAQPPQASPSPDQTAALEKKIDQINTKIDALSQQILKLEQQVSRPGTMIGETTPGPVPSAATSASETPHPGASNGNTHVVARGETLTSIAKQHKVGVEELQKFNHIEDGRKLQAGQTIMIPAPSASPASSASPSPSAE